MPRSPGLFWQANKAILEHDRKRRIELKCFELRVALEEKG